MPAETDKNPNNTPVEPHGTTELVNQIISGDKEQQLLGNVKDAPEVTLNTARFWDTQLIGRGVYSPLTGFMNEEDYESVKNNCRLSDGTVWPIPIVLPVPESKVDLVKKADEIQLVDSAGEPVAVLENPSLFERDKQDEAEKVYQTDEIEHPGVKNIYDEPDWAAGGDIRVFDRELDTGVEGGLQKWPRETREHFIERGWDTVVGFQTRNPMHRAHEYLVRCAMEITDGAMVHPLVGPTKGSDVPASVRMDCYQVVLNNYYPENRTMLNVFPAPMRYAGPREAIFHAICRTNYGCSHFIVGRDHAGVGDYYGTYEAQNFFSNFGDNEINTTPLFFEFAFYCEVCDGMATAKTCPHDGDMHLFLSGTKVRQKLRDGEPLPVEFTRTEVAEILMNHYQGESS